MHVVVCGGGVIGACVAYYLSRRGARVTLVERTAVGNAASGKSGGFLALDWCQGQPGDALARHSFALHAELDAALAVDWGYRRLDTLGVVASDTRDVSAYGRLARPEWLADETGVHQLLGGQETTAQVHPRLFTQAMVEAARSHGAELVIGTIEGVLGAEAGQARGVRVDGAELAADAVVLAMGPWSILACQWLPLPAVYGLKGHSFVFDYQPATPHGLFVEYESARGEIDSPEVMPRTDGTTYVCGARGTDPLPVDPAHVLPEDGPSERLLDQVRTFAPELGAAEILAVQACFRPVTEDGLPFIGAVPGVAGAYLATGHSVWGILNAPATGEAMAELLLDGEARLDLSPFAVNRLPTLNAAEVRTTRS